MKSASTKGTQINQMLKQVHDIKGEIGYFVIPNQVLNLALKQVQGLSNSIYDFGISLLVLNFKAPR
jgi:regulator of replication initiation timing